MLTASELDSMRATAQDWLTDTCAIQQYTEVDDQMGGSTRTWQVIEGLEAVPCRWAEPSSGGERAVASAITSGAVTVLEVAHDVPLSSKHRVISAGGDTVQVEAVLRPRTDQIVLRAVCRTVV